MIKERNETPFQVVHTFECKKKGWGGKIRKKKGIVTLFARPKDNMRAQ